MNHNERRYAVWHRKLTPKGNLGSKVEYRHHLDEEEMAHHVRQHLNSCAWLRVEVMDVPFKGSSFFGPKKKVLDAERAGISGNG